MFQPSENLVSEPIAPTGSTSVRHYQTGDRFAITWQDGILRTLEPASEAIHTDLWIAPGLFDLQVNGYAGVDFQSDDSISENALLCATRALRRDGCFRFLLTLITAPWPILIARIARFRAIIQSHPELRAAIPGWHIEGPFLSTEDGFRGAHESVWMRDPSSEHIESLKEVVQDDLVLLTLAPERDGAIPTIRAATHAGFVVSFGHSNAKTTQLQAAIAAGGSAYTHLANGCPQNLDRHDNIVWRVLNQSSLTIGIIPDSIHVSSDLFRIIHRAVDPARIYWTTDAMSAAGAPPGEYSIGQVKVHVGEDRIVRNPVTNGFAGSALTPIEGIRRGAQMLDRPWSEVWDFFSTHPAKLMGLSNKLAPGDAGGFCLIREV